MSNSIRKLVKDIQYTTELTLDEIADKLGYSRSYFRNEVSKGRSKSVLETIQAKFKDIIEQNVSRETQNGLTNVPDVDQFLVSKMLKQDAMAEVMLGVLAELLAKQTGQSVTAILSQLERSVVDKQTRIKEELRNSE